MIGVDLIGRIRRAYFDQHLPIKEIVRTLSVSRTTVRKVIRGGATEIKYEHGVALGRKAWLFAGSDRGGERAATLYSLIVTAKLNDIDPCAWLADVLRCIADHPTLHLHELLPWNWRPLGKDTAAAA